MTKASNAEVASGVIQSFNKKTRCGFISKTYTPVGSYKGKYFFREDDCQFDEIPKQNDVVSFHEEVTKMRHNAKDIHMINKKSNTDDNGGGETTDSARMHTEQEDIEALIFRCPICMDDISIEDVFITWGCGHQFCRPCFRKYIVGQIDEHVIHPLCPGVGDGCIYNVDYYSIHLLLTEEEQQKYYDLSWDSVATTLPGYQKCLVENCRGGGWLTERDVYFQCPVPSCGAERCVRCNTEEWHHGLSCEAYQMQKHKNDLHPKQIRDIYSGHNVYMCKQCSFGPIEHFYCQDLRTYHGQITGTARVNNACQQCGWFATDIYEWPKWDGVAWSEKQKSNTEKQIDNAENSRM